MQRGRRIPLDIYEEHLAEGAFLRSQRQRALDSSNHTIVDVAVGPEARLLAHLDGLVLGNRTVAERLLLPALSDDEADRVFVAAWALLQSEDGDWFEQVWAALLAATEPAHRDAIARAFELGTRPDLPARLEARLRQHDPLVDAVIVDVVAAHAPDRLARLPLRELGAAASEGSEALLVAVLRALQRSPASAPPGLVEAHLASRHVDVRAAAIEAGILLGVPSARAACRQTIAERTTRVRPAMTALAVLDDPADRERLRSWSELPDLRRDAIWALGASGSIDSVHSLLRHLDDPVVAPIAADSLSCILGLGIDGPFAIANVPASLDDGPGDHDPAPIPSPEDELRAPHAVNIRAWWRANAASFELDRRYVLGMPWTTASVASALARATTWRRPGLRLALGAPLASTIDLSTWAYQQRGWAPSSVKPPQRAPAAAMTSTG